MGIGKPTAVAFTLAAALSAGTASLGADVAEDPYLWLEDIHGEKSRLAGTIHPEEPGQRRIIHIDDAPGVVTNPRRQIRCEVDSQRVGEGAPSLVLNPQKLTHLGVASVRGEQVLATKLPTTATIGIGHRDSYAIGVLLHSGDLGVMDDEGFITVVDRKKDMIKTGGENVPSVRIEEVLLAHPAVQNAAVIGLPHPHWGEAVCAFVKLKPGLAADEDGISPIQLQQSVFLFSLKREKDLGLDFYEFEPHNYGSAAKEAEGPFSRILYTDLDALQADGLVTKSWQPGEAWSAFRPTERANDWIKDLRREAQKDALSYLEEAVAWVRQLSVYESVHKTASIRVIG